MPGGFRSQDIRYQIRAQLSMALAKMVDEVNLAAGMGGSPLLFSEVRPGSGQPSLLISRLREDPRSSRLTSLSPEGVAFLCPCCIASCRLYPC